MNGTTPPCSGDAYSLYSERCAVIQSPVFQPCLAVLRPLVAQTFYNICLYDGCATSDSTSVCRSVKVLADVCASEGAVVDNWEQAAGCGNKDYCFRFKLHVCNS